MKILLFRNWAKRERDEVQKISTKDLANLTGVSKGHTSEVLNGRAGLNLNTAIKLTEGLGYRLAVYDPLSGEVITLAADEKITLYPLQVADCAPILTPG